MIRTLLASSAAAALLAATAAAGTPGMSTADGPAWQMAQAQPTQEAQPPAAGDPAAPPADQPAATDQPPADTAQTPADQTSPDTAETPTDQTSPDTAQTPTDEPADTAESPADEPADTAETAADEPAAEPMDTAAFITEQAETHWLATDYIGDTIYNRQDEAIGNINDLIVEEDGGLVGFVVGVGGFLGIGQKQVAINLDAVEVQQDEEGRPKLVVAGSREALLDAPDFIDKDTQQAEMERQQRETQAPAGGAPGGAPGGMGGAPGGAPGGPPGQ